MMNGIELDVPMRSSGKIGPRWGQLEKYSDRGRAAMSKRIKVVEVQDKNSSVIFHGPVRAGTLHQLLRSVTPNDNIRTGATLTLRVPIGNEEAMRLLRLIRDAGDLKA